MGMNNDIFHKFTHKFTPITTIYDQQPNGPLLWAAIMFTYNFFFQKSYFYVKKNFMTIQKYRKATFCQKVTHVISALKQKLYRFAYLFSPKKYICLYIRTSVCVFETPIIDKPTPVCVFKTLVSIKPTPIYVCKYVEMTTLSLLNMWSLPKSKNLYWFADPIQLLSPKKYNWLSIRTTVCVRNSSYW